MSLPKRYNPQTREPELADQWQAQGTFHFERESDRPVFSIDTPPATVSGHLHLGHTYSYSHADFFARYRRMRGDNVFYPMGFDDNGLATERLVERLEGIRASEMKREAFIELCLAISTEAEKEYQALWERLGLSVDWNYTYRTISAESRHLAQWSFLDLYQRGLVYRQQAPTIWCPECRTAIAQAEVDDLERESVFYTLAFELESGDTLPIATTRPELLPACVAIFIHPDDPRATDLLGREARVPLFGQAVPILADEAADRQKGTGLVMCCTFGDTADVIWWRTRDLPLIEAIGRDGRMLAPAGPYTGLPTTEARRKMIADLDEAGRLLAQQPISQTIRVHERCDTAVEYIVSNQWFIRVLDFKEELLARGEEVNWHPPHMHQRYRQWVENLAWDWGISRQRFFGVPFPLWYCKQCGEVLLATEEELPLDPTEHAPGRPCPVCGSTEFTAEQDVMDTWATSSLTPQIAGRMFSDPTLYEMCAPFDLRPQAHEIIRTWAFYTIVKSHHHFGERPWADTAISGWALAPKGTAKLSKSRGGGPMSPMEMIERYSADAVRYWAASTALGKDAHIDEQKIIAGSKLATKLWNVARFAGRFLEEEPLDTSPGAAPSALTLADRWILARLQQLVARVTALLDDYDYATAKSEMEIFFWTELADNYLEMAKQRLYSGGPAGAGARYTLHHALLTTIKLFAPLLPFITEAIYQGLFDPAGSIHRSTWPEPEPRFTDEALEAAGTALITIATAVRRHKSETGLALGADLGELHIAAPPALTGILEEARPDLLSITRASEIRLVQQLPTNGEVLLANGQLQVALAA